MIQFRDGLHSLCSIYRPKEISECLKIASNKTLANVCFAFQSGVGVPLILLSIWDKFDISKNNVLSVVFTGGLIGTTFCHLCSGFYVGLIL